MVKVGEHRRVVNLLDLHAGRGDGKLHVSAVDSANHILSRLDVEILVKELQDYLESTKPVPAPNVLNTTKRR